MLLESKEGKVAAVFGPEKTGLHNDDLDLCHTLLTIPTNPEFSSLNLAMAVQVLTYELRVASSLDGGPGFESEVPPASGEDMEHFYVHLERVLEDIHFLNPDNPRHLMRRIRRLFIRARPDQNEVNILRGILTAVDRTRSRTKGDS
jgi:TrmH family RNA methyltransferase